MLKKKWRKWLRRAALGLIASVLLGVAGFSAFRKPMGETWRPSA